MSSLGRTLHHLAKAHNVVRFTTNVCVNFDLAPQVEPFERVMHLRDPQQLSDMHWRLTQPLREQLAIDPGHFRRAIDAETIPPLRRLLGGALAPIIRVHTEVLSSVRH